MKNKSRITGALLLTLGLVACDVSGLKDTIDDFGLLIALEPIHTVGTVLVVDAKTGELINDRITVTFAGPQGADVIDSFSDPLARETFTNGILNFGLRNSVNPTPENPASVQLIFSGEGYVSSSRTLSFGGEGRHSFFVTMIDQRNPPPGFQSVRNRDGQAGANGAIQQSFSVEASAEQNGVSLDVPAGAVFRDAAGNTLSGQISTQLTYFDPTDSDVMGSLPADLVTADGEMIYTLGLFDLQIEDAQGRRAQEVSFPENSSKFVSLAEAGDGMNLEFRIPEGSVNPQTGAPLQEGDELFLFVYEQDNVQKNAGSGFDTMRYNFQTGCYVIRPGTGPGTVFCPRKLPLPGPPPQPIQEPNEAPRPAPTPPPPAVGIPGPPVLDVYNVRLTHALDRAVTVRMSQTGLRPIDVSIPANSTSNGFQASGTSRVYSYSIDLGYEIKEGTHDFAVGDLVIDTNPANIPAGFTPKAGITATLVCPNREEKVNVQNPDAASIVYRRKDAPSGTRFQVVEDVEWNWDESDLKLSGASFDIFNVEIPAEYTFRVDFDGKQRSTDILIDSQTFTYVHEAEPGMCN